MKQKYKIRAGHTPETMKATLDKYLPKEGRCLTDDEGEDICAYERPDGTRCAAGAFWPDDSPERPSAVEYSNVGVNLLPSNVRDAMPLDVNGMLTMQRIHDCSRDSDDIRALLSQFIDTQCEA